MENKKWSAELPICEPRICEKFSVKNARVTFTNIANIFPETQAIIECNRGYKIIGSGTLECITVDGRDMPIWDSEIPRCEEIICEDPDVGPNVTITHRSFLFTIIQ